MNRFLSCVAMALAFVCCSIAVAVEPITLVPVPDPGPSYRAEEGICIVCGQIMAQIVQAQGQYEFVEGQVEDLYDWIDQAQQTIISIQANPNYSVPLKLQLISFQENKIATWESMLASKEAELREIADTIHSLWDQWHAAGCSTAGC